MWYCVRWIGLWTLRGSIHGLGFRSLPGYETIGFGCGVDAGEGAISWHLRMQEVTASGTSDAEYVALSEEVNEVIFETGAGVHGTVDERRRSECVRRQ